MQTRAFPAEHIAHFRGAIRFAVAKEINVPFLIRHDYGSSSRWLILVLFY
jgi:hypothetical protein